MSILVMCVRVSCGLRLWLGARDVRGSLAGLGEWYGEGIDACEHKTFSIQFVISVGDCARVPVTTCGLISC